MRAPDCVRLWRFGRKTIFTRCLAATAILGAWPPLAWAGGGPENLMLVVNSSSWTSMAVANFYIPLRQIPPANVIYLNWNESVDTTTADKFRERILGPVLQMIERRGLADQIDYLVYSCDFPTTIDFSADVASLKLPQPITPLCSINAATYFWQHTMVKNPRVLGLKNNRYMRAAKGRTTASATHGFRSWYGWGPGGELLEAGGESYLLSTVLATTAGRGNSMREVVEYLGRAAKADGAKPAGSVYFCRTSDVRTTTRAERFENAAAELKALGVQASIVDGVMPSGKDDVQGVLMGAAAFNWKDSGSALAPGALGENLTSFGGILREDAGQTPLNEFLRYGAAGASGAVVEPYAIADKFPAAEVFVHYAQGCTLAEAFYQSTWGPFQLLIVGDPLCRPWANIAEIKAEGLVRGEKVSGKLTIAATAKYADEKVKAGSFELFVDGRRIASAPAGQPLNFDSSEVCDGYHEFRIVAIESGPIASQSRAIFPVMVSNFDRGMTFAAASKRVRVDQAVKVKVDAPGCSNVMFFQNGRLLGKVDGDEGEFDVNARQLGMGVTEISALALGEEGKLIKMSAPPIEVMIGPQPSLPASHIKGKLLRGLLLRVNDAQPQPVQDTRPADWLAKAGVKPGDTYELEGVFEVSQRELYQFHVDYTGEMRLNVDEIKMYGGSAKEPEYVFVPIALDEGQHLLRVIGKAGPESHLRISFGLQGVRSLDGQSFRHEAATLD